MLNNVFYDKKRTNKYIIIKIIPLAELKQTKLPVSHLDSGLLVIFVVGQGASSQHEVTMLPVLD